MNAFWQNLCFLLSFRAILDHVTQDDVRGIADFPSLKYNALGA